MSVDETKTWTKPRGEAVTPIVMKRPVRDFTVQAYLPAVAKGLRHGLVGVRDIRVFADEGDRHLAIRVPDGAGDTLPRCQIRRRRVRDSEV